MNLWNVFRMELFKNLHDRISFFMMIVLMCVNIIGGLVVSNLVINEPWLWNISPNLFQIVMIWLLFLSFFASLAFMFIYPYRLARVDYKNKVMSLMIASGVSRVQYYFVKVGATFIFSFASFLFVIFIPLVIATRGLALTGLTFLHLEFDLGIGFFLLPLLSWLSMFFMLMTAVIVMKGKGSTIFVYFGFSTGTSMVATILQGMLRINRWNSLFALNTFIVFQHVLTIAVFTTIGILVLRKQDL